MVGPWEMPELEIRECPPSMIRNVDGRPLEGDVGDPEALTINANKRR
jgi:hypothetical protein